MKDEMSEPSEPSPAPTDYIAASTRGEKCSVCGSETRWKVGEEIFDDDPAPIRHNLTAYLCDLHFRWIMGDPGVDWVQKFRAMQPSLMASPAPQSEPWLVTGDMAECKRVIDLLKNDLHRTRIQLDAADHRIVALVAERDQLRAERDAGEAGLVKWFERADQLGDKLVTTERQLSEAQAKIERIVEYIRAYPEKHWQIERFRDVAWEDFVAEIGRLAHSAECDHSDSPRFLDSQGMWCANCRTLIHAAGDPSTEEKL